MVIRDESMNLKDKMVIRDESKNSEDKMVIYDESKSYVGVAKDSESKESEDSGSRCEDLYVQLANAIRKETRKDDHVRQAEYADAKEKGKCRACRQCSQNGASVRCRWPTLPELRMAIPYP